MGKPQDIPDLDIQRHMCDGARKRAQSPSFQDVHALNASFGFYHAVIERSFIIRSERTGCILEKMCFTFIVNR